MRGEDGASSRSHAARRGCRQARYQALLAELRFTRPQQLDDVYHDDDDNFPSQYAPEPAWVGLILLEPLCGEFSAERFRPLQSGSGGNDFCGSSSSPLAQKLHPSHAPLFPAQIHLPTHPPSSVHTVPISAPSKRLPGSPVRTCSERLSWVAANIARVAPPPPPPL